MTDVKKGDSDSSVARLIRLAGTRDMPAEDTMRRARTAAYTSWQRGLQTATQPPATRKRFSWWPFALAASCGLIAILVMNRPAPVEPHVVANVVAVDARPVMRAATDESLVAGMQLREGAMVDTEGGRAAFLLGDSLSLRADRHTQIRFEAADRVRVLSGNVYVDSGGLNAVSQLRIETPAGEVRHLGTQFLVTVDRNATRVQVREGRVTLARAGEAPRGIAAGDALEVEGANVRLVQGLPSHGAQWEWAAATAPAFDIENRPLAEFLAWVAREHGWQLAYHDDSTRQRVHDIRLHGSVADLSVTAMLERVELITGVSLHVRDGMLAVGNEVAP
jgi:hypothetical protein